MELTFKNGSKVSSEKLVCANLIQFTKGSKVELTFLKFEIDW